jgi:hypothetical protein
MKTAKITAKDHKEYKAWALKACQEKLNKLTEKERMELALMLDISFGSVQLYKKGKGNNIETMLRIIEG